MALPLKVRAQEAFAFLGHRGFTLQPPPQSDRLESDLSWQFEYRSQSVTVRVLFDMHQFEVGFHAHATHASYQFIDREVYGRRSGFYGDMFGPDKIVAAIDQIATDVQANYGIVLSGDPALWAKIAKLKAVPAEKPRLP